MTDDVQPGPITPPRFNGEDLSRLSISGEGGVEAAPMRQRCAVLGIDWLEEEPAVSAEAVALIDPEVAVRLRVVPLRLERDRLLVAMLDPLDIVAVDEVSALRRRSATSCGPTTAPPRPAWLRAWPARPATAPKRMSSTTSTPSRRTTSIAWPSSPR
jgi:hypothetical protein